MSRLSRTLALPACALLLAGCTRLDFERTYDLEGRMTQEIAWDAPKYEQKLTVTVSAEEPVSVYLVKEDDKEKAKQALSADKEPEGALASNVDAKEVTLQATVPAKTAAAVLIRNRASKNRVKVKVTGR
jgi:hypothetical protein